MIVVYDYFCRVLQALFWVCAAGFIAVLAIVGAHFLVMVVTFIAAYLYGVLA